MRQPPSVASSAIAHRTGHQPSYASCGLPNWLTLGSGAPLATASRTYRSEQKDGQDPEGGPAGNGDLPLPAVSNGSQSRILENLTRGSEAHPLGDGRLTSKLQRPKVRL